MSREFNDKLLTTAPQGGEENTKQASAPWGFAPFGEGFSEKYYILQKERREIKGLSNAAGLSLIFTLLINYLISFGTALVLMLGFGEKGFNILSEPAVSSVMQIAFTLLGFTLPFLLFYKAWGHRISDLVHFGKTKKGMALPLFFFGVAFFAFCNIGASYIDSLLSAIGLSTDSPELAMPKGFFGFIIMTISTAVMPALLEEFALRGIVLGSLRKYGNGFAVVASAILFGLMHGNLGQIPFTAFVGLYLGFTVVKTNSLRVAIVLHFYNNFLSVVLSYLPDGLPIELQNIIYVVILMVALILGIFSLSSDNEELFEVKGDNARLLTPIGSRYKYFFTAAAFIIFVILNVIQIILQSIL